MAFISIHYVMFLFIVFFLYYTVSLIYRRLILLLASIFFISTFSVSFLLYALFITAINFFAAKYIYNNSNGKKRKVVYITGQIFNIGGLFLFKYINFLLENINYVFDWFSLNNITYLKLVIPVGISYYTFQGISYLYLVYKAKDKPETDFVSFALYMLFFSKILAGPIERHRKFLPQLKRDIVFESGNISDGIRLFLWGALKKVLIADVIIVIINSGLRNSDLTGFKTAFVFLLLPVYMYADFSGYTDMARGTGRIFGYTLAMNFNYPLFSRSVSDFWRRWHISLSLWCNDFIFNRLLLKRKKWGKYAFIYAIFVTFLVIGLWHGASFNFIVLGLLQAMVISIEFLTNKKRKEFFRRKNKLLVHIISSVMVYLFVAVTLTLFFNATIKETLIFLSGLFNNWNSFSLRGFDINEGETVVSFLFILFFLSVELIAYIKNINIKKLLPAKKTFRFILYFTALVLIIYFSKYQNVFVYENF